MVSVTDKRQIGNLYLLNGTHDRTMHLIEVSNYKNPCLQVLDILYVQKLEGFPPVIFVCFQLNGIRKTRLS
jgi:hypothetical protein